ncbi:MAG: hypothetical protein HOP33_04420 [Verrucomicrobia bacterium]|nr:hypothetical protein [Verrucomicrobiota bacterium]
MKLLVSALLLTGFFLFIGCSTAPQHHVTLTGAILKCGGKRSATPLWIGGAS